MRILFSLLLLGTVSKSLSAQGTQLLRQPTLSSSHIVFVYANDIWKVSRNGGTAIRLTSNEGYESLPHYSPDEQWIAFTAEYDGNTDVYVIPADGGSPQRLTWHPISDYVQGWTPNGEVMFRSAREAHPTETTKFYSVPLLGGLPKSLPIPRAAYGEISADGLYAAYVPITSWDPEWRNYRGGQAMPIWIQNLETAELIRTPQPTLERHLDPVWHEGKVFYLSERDYASNIWSFDPNSREEQQLTHHKKFDVKSLDAGPDGIVYEMGGYLHLLNPVTKASNQLEINVQGDMNFARPRWEEVTASSMDDVRISPGGKRLLFTSRGDVFTTPKEEGSWRNLTNSSGHADRNAVWSPTGTQIAWFSDESGEYQLVISGQKGEDKKTYSLPNPTFYFAPDWSPDGKHIAYTDTDYNIWVFEVASGKAEKVDTDRYAHPNRDMNPVWSPDSKWIAYARQLESHFKAVFIFEVETGRKIQVTDGMADAITPVWDQNGKYLYFLASTDYGLNSGWLDMSSYDPDDSRGLYCTVLSKDGKSPLLVKSDEEQPKDVDEEASKKEDEKEDENEEGIEDLNIEADGIMQRTVALNLPTRNYSGLNNGHANSVFVTEVRENEEGSILHKFDTEENESEEFLTGVRTLVTSYDGAYIAYLKDGSWYLEESKAKPGSDAEPLNLGARVRIDPLAEYRQIFREGWRYMRDFLYVNNVHGAPWDEVYAWYAPWIDHVRHRTDLNYVVDIMSGEVSVGHSYVAGGDMPDVERVPIGLLGCGLEEENGNYRIKKIYTGESWNPHLEAPLSAPGLEVQEGDYLLAVNGRALQTPTNPYSLFEQTSGQATYLTVADNPADADTREILVRPVSSEFELRRWDWIEGNRRKVDELSSGKLAYVYLPNTGQTGFTYFNRMYFAQQDRKGVVIDERNNGGGSAADYMIDIMSRKLFGYFNSKANDNRPWTTPMAGLWGPKVMIINERAGSGGDLLPYMFRENQLGPLVGTRTWGGLVGTWDTPRFIDGGRMVAPRGGFFDLDGKWAVEGDGVAPDIEVIQDPAKRLQGHDPQLERAVEEAMRLLEADEFQLKPEPPPPIRWKRPEGFQN